MVKIGATPYGNFTVHHCEKQIFGKRNHRVFKKFPTFHGTPTFHYVAQKNTLFQAKGIQPVTSRSGPA